MKIGWDYTWRAYRLTARFPIAAYIGIQTNFWIFANLLLATILHLQALQIDHVFGVKVAGDFSQLLIMAFIFGISQGIILGFSGYFLDQRVFRKMPLGKMLFVKSLVSLGAVMIVFEILRTIMFDRLNTTSMFGQPVRFDKQAFRNSFWLLLVYYSFMTLVINFINQVNKKYGPGIVIPLLFGRYRRPREEYRMFLFMDLQSSTATAEKLGHLKYSAFIQDCFSDINQLLYRFGAQVYQYVGDEIVVTWPESEGLRNNVCVHFYFACKQQFEKRREHYIKNYGLVPSFKAGLHTGIVTVVEIGEVKRDIAYHGDTLNTASRIQSVCNEYQREFLASVHLYNMLPLVPDMKIEELGSVLLKGKKAGVGIVSIGERDS